MQRVQMHHLQEKLLLLLPGGLCEVLPGLRLQRGFGQVQLLRLKWDSPQLPLRSSSFTRSGNGPQLLLLHRQHLHLLQFLWLQRLQVHLLQEELLLLLPSGLLQVCPGLRLQRGIGQVHVLCLMGGRCRSHV
ncbi:hypothetical protein NN561_007098 [Cricetulus griseus]